MGTAGFEGIPIGGKPKKASFQRRPTKPPTVNPPCELKKKSAEKLYGKVATPKPRLEHPRLSEQCKFPVELGLHRFPVTYFKELLPVPVPVLRYLRLYTARRSLNFRLQLRFKHARFAVRFSLNFGARSRN